jgi:hypothetical protein
MIGMQGSQAEAPRPIPEESNQRRPYTVTPCVVVDTDLIDVEIKSPPGEIRFQRASLPA